MSKKFKGNQNQKSQTQPKKGQTIAIGDADQTTYLTLLGDDYHNDGNIKLACKILADHTYLLQATPVQFCATLAHTITLQDSLDLWLRYAPRKHLRKEELAITGDYGMLVSQIYQSILAIFMRISEFEEEDPVYAEQINYAQMLYDKWIIDIMKLTDIAQIFGEKNPESVQKIIKQAFKFQTYHADYSTTVSQLASILTETYIQISGVNNKSLHETEVFIDDIQSKMQILVKILDLIETLIVWVTFFPSKQLVFNPVNLMPLVEQIFYEIIVARGYERGQVIMKGLWKFKSLVVDNTYYLDLCLTRITDFFVKYVEFVTNLGLENNLVALKEHMSYLVLNFGIFKRKGKKGQQKEWLLLEAIHEKGCELPDILASVIPWDNLSFNKQETEETILIMRSAIEERDMIKSRAFKVEVEEIPEFDNFNIEESALKDQLSDHGEAVPGEEEEEEPVQIVQEEVLEKMVSKKKQVLKIDQQYNELTLKMYNDEPDDTYDYQEAIQRPEKDYDSSEDDDDVYAPNDLQYGNYNKQPSKPHNLVQSAQNLDSSNTYDQRQQPQQGYKDDFNQRSYKSSADPEYRRDDKFRQNDQRQGNNFKDRNNRSDEPQKLKGYKQQQQQDKQDAPKVLTRNRDGGYVRPMTNGQKTPQVQYEEKDKLKDRPVEKINNKPEAQLPKPQQQPQNQYEDKNKDQDNDQGNNNQQKGQKPYNKSNKGKQQRGKPQFEYQQK